MTRRPWTRREFLRTGTGAAMVIAAPRPLMVQWGRRAPEPVPSIVDPRIKDIALAAVDAARAAGARYASVCLTHTWLPSNFLWGQEEMSIGVRALLDGYWGFASSPHWTLDEAARLGRVAAGQARTNASGQQRPVELAPTPVVRDGHWETPIRIDPFTVPQDEIADYISSLMSYLSFTAPGYDPVVGWSFTRQEKAFASSDGSYCTQRLDSVQAGFSLERNGVGAGYRFPGGPRCGAGWEYIRDPESALRASVPRLMEEIDAELALPIKTMNPDRYDTVFDAATAANFLTPTIGLATELDRAMGYEANAGGTSYLTDPVEMLGTYLIGNERLTVTANRSMRGGLATVKWDDEGVAPDEITLVNKGVLSDFLTMRESAAWIKPVYARTNRPFRSHGCAVASQGLEVPLTRIPNLVMAPGQSMLDFDGLVAGIEKGVAVRYGGPSMDFQQRAGTGGGSLYEIRRGKRVARVQGLGFMFRTPEPWKNLIAIGGPTSVESWNGSSVKGEPPQPADHSVSAVPIAVQQFTFVDRSRRA